MVVEVAWGEEVVFLVEDEDSLDWSHSGHGTGGISCIISCCQVWFFCITLPIISSMAWSSWIGVRLIGARDPVVFNPIAIGVAIVALRESSVDHIVSIVLRVPDVERVTPSIEVV